MRLLQLPRGTHTIQQVSLSEFVGMLRLTCIHLYKLEILPDVILINRYMPIYISSYIHIRVDMIFSSIWGEDIGVYLVSSSGLIECIISCDSGSRY